ncbi:MAG: helix-turn-helix domain-containing protein [Clostridia bacterium]|nr:helix-turn-helix domain-containing protein [Clostridia bacterium]
MTNNIGTNIASLRKEKGTKQEELANFVGVSAQAVSKWENGGLPDTELLPRIADFFGVSIDTLFGRSIADYSDVETALAKKLADVPHEERINTAFELCWTIERAMYDQPLRPEDTLANVCSGIDEGQQRYSSIRRDNGYTEMGLGRRLSYFLLVPEIADMGKALLDGIDYPTLFADLADRTFFDTLVYLNRRDHNKAFTPNLLVKNLGLSADAAKEMLEKLKKYQLVHITTVEMDDEPQEVYTFQPSPSFPALLIFAREMIDRPNCFHYFYGGRCKPYLA